MNYVLHPAAALEHEEQVAYYEARSPGLGRAAITLLFFQLCCTFARLLTDTRSFKRLAFASCRWMAFRSALFTGRYAAKLLFSQGLLIGDVQATGLGGSGDSRFKRVEAARLRDVADSAAAVVPSD